MKKVFILNILVLFSTIIFSQSRPSRIWMPDYILGSSSVIVTDNNDGTVTLTSSGGSSEGDTLYVDYCNGCLETSGWKRSSDTIYIDTSTILIRSMETRFENDSSNVRALIDLKIDKSDTLNFAYLNKENTFTENQNVLGNVLFDGNLTMPNIVYINDTNDLPPLISGKYHLTDSTKYIITSFINIKHPIFMGNDCALYGTSNRTSGLIFNNGTSDTLIHSYNTGIKIFDLGFYVSGTNTLFNLNDTTQKSQLNISQLYIYQCNNVGVIKGFLQTGINENCFINTLKGLTIRDGRCFSFNLNKGSIIGADTLLKIKSGKDYLGILINNNEFYIADSSVAYFISDTVEAEGSQLIGNNLFGGGVYLTGIDENSNDYNWRVVGNNNVDDFKAYITLQEGNNSGTFTANSNDTVIFSNITTNVSDSSRFSSPTTNKAIYLGKKRMLFNITFIGSCGTTSNHVAEPQIWKNGQVINGAVNRMDIDRNDYVPLTVQTTVSLEQNDYIEMYYYNTKNNNKTVSINNYILIITEI